MAGRNDDEQHLRLLTIFHYIVAGLTALFAILTLGYAVIGWAFLHAPPPKHGQPPPVWFGWIFVCIGITLFLLGESFAVCILAAGRSLRSRRGYWFVFVIACLECVFFPFGTVLGLFTLIVLSRESVKQLFGRTTLERTTA